MSQPILRIPFRDMLDTFQRILQAHGFEPTKAERCARVFTESSLDGVYSHGVLRFPRFVDYIKKGYVDVHAEPVRTASLGALEQWDGALGPGPLNAMFAADRVMQLADEFGVGVIGMGNTNHWMRGGTYGWQAARAGYAYMGWTNTEPNMPAWGAAESRLGNNPLVLALPFGDEAIVLDMAMTQFAYGKLEECTLQGKKLPLPGGFDKTGAVTDDPEAILDTMLGLPIGYWKGAGLSLLLDLMAATLSGGRDVKRLGELESEYGVSQVFIAFNLQNLPNAATIRERIRESIDFLKASAPISEEQEVLYPGERVLRTRAENMEKGIPVLQSVWKEITALV